MLDVGDALIIFLKVLSIIVILDLALLILLWKIKKYNLYLQEENKISQSARDDRIFEEVDRFYGAPW